MSHASIIAIEEMDNDVFLLKQKLACIKQSLVLNGNGMSGANCEDLNNMLDAALVFHLVQRFLGTIHPAVDLGDVFLESFHLTLVILHDRWKARFTFGLFCAIGVLNSCCECLA